MEAYAQDVINRYELGKKGLDIEEQKLVKDVILGMLEIASKGEVTMTKTTQMDKKTMK